MGALADEITQASREQDEDTESMSQAVTEMEQFGPAEYRKFGSAGQ
jgi:hypothetical protein